jgi:hypothetical protein
VLRAIVENRSVVSRDTLPQLDWEWLMGRTEGYLARDLEHLVSRAIHAQVLLLRMGELSRTTRTPVIQTPSLLLVCTLTIICYRRPFCNVM